MYNDFLIKTIEDMLSIHSSIEKKWIEYLRKEQIETKNFNSLKVYKIFEDESILGYIRKYINFINKQAVLITACFDYKIIDRTRVKDSLSIEQKVYAYCCKPERGRIKIHKCLNDLFGVRIVLNDTFDCESLLQSLRKNFPEKVIITNSSKPDGYKAIHVYTPAMNGHFKWELQIWDRESYALNISLHESHKRQYLTDLKEAAQAEKGK
nr:MAG TPA: hypothetical protein [Caudoviricetes sp.]